MKKLILIFVIAVIFAACSKDNTVQPTNECTTCTEQYTQVQSTFCGSHDAVEQFKTNLIHDGAAYGQKWTCKDSK